MKNGYGVLSRRAFLTGLTVMPITAALSDAVAKAQPTKSMMSAYSHSTGRFFGAAVRMDQIEAQPDLRDAVISDCSCITPEIHLKWNSIQHEKASFWFKPVDDLVAFASEHGMSVHGHTLLWDQSIPEWANAELGGQKPNWEIVRRYFEAVLSR